ncbi:MAG: outer membrane lipoprotein-sorting protein [Gammaproteobacteria bacterium]|nr:outer membrane lipoprotein-sorting protein [Gammaproteobacteria bacterium]
MRFLLSIVALTLLMYFPAQAQDEPEQSPEQRGRRIAAEAERRDQGFGDSATEITMRLMSSDGRIRERRLTWQTLESVAASEGDKSLTVFHEPRDIEGTAFLSYTHIEQADDQWLYLPALKRVKRIASANQSSAFMGSEFAYEDLLSDEVEKFDYLWLRDEPCRELTCFVLERRPRYEDSGYSRQVVWIDQAEYRAFRIEYYDHRERHEKTLVFEDYRQYLDRFWRAHEMRMTNHLTDKETLLLFEPYAFQTGQTEQDFDPSALRRLR